MSRKPKAIIYHYTRFAMHLIAEAGFVVQQLSGNYARLLEVAYTRVLTGE